MVDPPLPAVVVGGGPAGLATSRELARRGVAHRVLERGSAVGACWREAYDSLTLHTGKHLSALPGLRHDRKAPLFLPRDAFVDYLERYATRFGLPVEAGCEVEQAIPEPDGWVLETGGGALHARWLVLATGIMANPWAPSVPGSESFAGRLLHSADYRRPDAFRGRRVVVVGCGNSAAEIASELADHGTEVVLAVRSGTNVVPLAVLGVPVQYLAWAVNRLPRPARGPIVALFQTLTRARGGPPVLPRAQGSPLDRIPVIGFRLVDRIRAGRVRVRGVLVGLSEHAARFADDGPDVPADDVILATGYRAAVAPVAHTVRLDDRGFVCRRDRVVAVDAPNLLVVGHNYDATGGLHNIRRDAPRAARLIARDLQ